MSFLGEPFKYDLFVSYSHGDFEGSGRSNLRAWSQAFARELEGELRQHAKFGQLRIFLDQQYRPDQGFDPSEPLTTQLRNDIQASGMLVVLMSPQYLQSKWCSQELDWWARGQERAGLSTDGRIAVARIWPTDEPWPEVLLDERGQALVGFTFYDFERAETRPFPYEWPDPTGATGPFREALLKMVDRIWQRLNAFKEQLEERRQLEASAARLAAADGQVVYLHARQTSARAWGRVGDALAQKGFVVVPAEPDPISRDPKVLREIAEQRVDILSSCDGLLLLGTEDGRSLDADLVVVGRQDRRLARTRSDRLLPGAVLDTVGGKIATPRRIMIARALGIDWIDATRDIWPSEIKRWLIDASAVVERV
jgi:hypothetical protein